MSWFSKPALPAPVVEHKPLKTKLKYPKWTFVRIENSNDYYLLLDTTKMKFISERAFHSWGKNYIVASEQTIAGYTNWKKIGFAPGTLLISIADKTEWFVTGNDVLATERRRITNPDFYSALGFDLDDAYVVSLNEVDFHKKGEDIEDVGVK